MKKLIITAMIAMMGIAVNAATVKWQANAIQSSPDNAVGAGWLVQVFTSDVVFDYAAAKAGSITLKIAVEVNGESARQPKLAG